MTEQMKGQPAPHYSLEQSVGALFYQTSTVTGQFCGGLVIVLIGFLSNLDSDQCSHPPRSNRKALRSRRRGEEMPFRAQHREVLTLRLDNGHSFDSLSGSEDSQRLQLLAAVGS